MKIYLLFNCYECPDSSCIDEVDEDGATTGDWFYECDRFKDPRRIPDAFNKFPEWCPLKDFIQEEELAQNGDAQKKE